MIVVEPDMRVDQKGLIKLCFQETGEVGWGKGKPFLAFPLRAICIELLDQSVSRYTDWRQTH